MHSRQLASKTGLTVPQLLCLRAIDELATDEDDVTLAKVSAALQLSQSTVSNIIERLVRAGLVDRQRSARDRRRVHLTLTGDGAERLRGAPRQLQDRFLARVERLPATERDRLLAALEEVVELLGAEELDAAPMLIPGSDVSPRGNGS